MKAILLLAAALAFGVAPFITEGFAGFRPDQFPVPQEDAPVQPAGYAFAIWSVIYLWLLVSAVVGAWRHRDDAAWDAARVPMIVSLGVGAFWIKVATLSVIWATVLIWVMLLTALWALIAGRSIAPGWAFSWPTGLYAGWLTAASCVALGLLGAGYGFGPAQTWAIAMIAGALVLGVTVLRAACVWTYGVALAWALVGILVANGASTVGGLAMGGAVVIAALTLGQLRARA